MSVVAVWSAADISINFAGIDIDADAMPEDDVIEISQDQPDFTVKKGVGGGTTRSKVVNPTRTVKLRLRQCAAVNSTLAAVINLDRITPGGAGIAPLKVTDRNGNFKFLDTQSFITQDPTWKAGKEEDVLEWTITSTNCQQFTGGH